MSTGEGGGRGAGRSNRRTRYFADLQGSDGLFVGGGQVISARRRRRRNLRSPGRGDRGRGVEVGGPGEASEREVMPRPSSDSPGRETAARRASSFSRGWSRAGGRAGLSASVRSPTILRPSISIRPAGKAKPGHRPLDIRRGEASARRARTPMMARPQRRAWEIRR